MKKTMLGMVLLCAFMGALPSFGASSSETARNTEFTRPTDIPRNEHDNPERSSIGGADSEFSEVQGDCRNSTNQVSCKKAANNCERPMDSASASAKFCKAWKEVVASIKSNGGTGCPGARRSMDKGIERSAANPGEGEDKMKLAKTKITTKKCS